MIFQRGVAGGGGSSWSLAGSNAKLRARSVLSDAIGLMFPKLKQRSFL
jgi:hypothetical protein